MNFKGSLGIKIVGQSCEILNKIIYIYVHSGILSIILLSCDTTAYVISLETRGTVLIDILKPVGK